CVSCWKWLTVAEALGLVFLFFQAEGGIRYWSVTGVKTCPLPISGSAGRGPAARRPARTLRRPPAPRACRCPTCTTHSRRRAWSRIHLRIPRGWPRARKLRPARHDARLRRRRPLHRILSPHLGLGRPCSFCLRSVGGPSILRPCHG